MHDQFLIEYFYKYEKERANRPYLHQPFSDTWETYTWAEVGQKARRLATWLKKQCSNDVRECLLHYGRFHMETIEY